MIIEYQWWSSGSLLMDLHAVCCTLLLLTCSGLGFGQQLILPERINKAVGENVVITPIRLPDLPHYLIRWEFNTTSIVVGTDVLPPYTDRVSIDTTTLALEIRNLTENDTGPYILTINTATTVVTGQTSLQVLVPVSSVTIVPSQTELVEFNSTVSFVCSASGSFVSFIWLNGSSEITAGERVLLTDNNSSLTITSVIRGDTGPYECEASNSISRKKSLPLSLIIYYKGNAGGDSLSAGAIAGIVIGVLLGVAGIAGLIFYFVKVKEMPKTNSRGNNQSGATHNAGGHDSYYEHMVGFQNQNPEVNVGRSDTHPIKGVKRTDVISSEKRKRNLSVKIWGNPVEDYSDSFPFNRHYSVYLLSHIVINQHSTALFETIIEYQWWSSGSLLMDLHAVCCTLLLLTCSGLGFGQQLILPERINKAVGENVVITPIRLPDLPHYLIRWEFNTTTIVVGTDVLPPYTDRVSIDTTTLALEIRNLTENDTGPYILTINTATAVVTGQTSLQVLVPVSSVTIVPSQTELVEYNSTVNFVCSASGSSLSFIWLNGSSEITAGERVQLTDNNSSLTITSVIRGDTGPYECEASNSISRNKSLPLSLIIYYGPEYVSASADPVGPFYSSGSNLILTCSAVSSPPAEFQWAVNGTELGEMGRELKLSNIQISQSGNYTCIAHNKQSLRFSVSQPISVTVLVQVSSVTIIPSLKEVELNSTVSFFCSASGSSVSFIWLNGSSEVMAGERVQLTDNNRNLTITSVIRGDTGPYECEASNSISRKKSPPLILTIKINDSTDEGGGGDSLSAGAIAGIVIGVLLGVAGIAVLIFYLTKGKKTSRTTSSGNKQNGAASNEGQHELHYADVRHLRNNQGQPGTSATGTAPTPSYVARNNMTATSNPATQIIYSDVRNL
ncbi:uncharacterized protein LOC131351658 [Hemibagrus wyckioides]|uniref:uncharacterized protein LOC131351658 n=1 Tax=Hemibagrus wyckioides TaxID=337641 RepID=UPI00266CCC28|nr:uncharacterized protein LOC131351658 [Hemibagrus wyckioides]